MHLKLTAAQKIIIHTLEKAGYEVRFVGGWVRDTVLGYEPKDTDMATNAYPLDSMQLFAKFPIIKSGLDFGSLKIIIYGEAIDLTSLRKDIKSDGRFAVVTYGATWQEDALRRDFTINAMSMDSKGNLYDYFDGYRDLLNHTIRFVGDPKERIQEDYLRILRFFRFFSRFGKYYDPKVIGIIKSLSSKLLNLSNERISSELIKWIKTDNAATSLRLALDTGVIDIVLPNASIKSFIPFHNFFLRILSLYPTLNLSDRDKISFQLNKKNKNRLHYLQGIVQEDSYDLFYLLCSYEFSSICDYAQLYGNMRLLKQIHDYPIPYPEFPITGDDVMCHTSAKGKQVGEILKNLKDQWILSKFQLSKKYLITKLIQYHVREIL